MEKKFNFVYITTNLINGKQYVGDHSTDDLNCAYTKRYLGSGRPYFDNAKKKYGKENFKREILEFFPTKKDAHDSQEKYINEYNTLAPNGYNISPAGGFDCSNGWSEEQRKQLSLKRKGISLSKEHKENISKAKKGVKNSIEHNNNIRLCRLNTTLSEETKLNISKGNTLWHNTIGFSEESKNQNRQSHLGKKLSKEHKNSISKSLTGKKRGKYDTNKRKI